MCLRGFSDFFGCNLRRESLDHLPVTSNQEFREVPRDVFISVIVGMTRLQKLIDLGGTVTVHFELREHRKRHAVFRGRKLKDLGICPRFLCSELIARKAKDTEAIIVVM
jgi:hypothetical protein